MDIFVTYKKNRLIKLNFGNVINCKYSIFYTFIEYL